jgi:hypothetical protein
MNSAVEQLLAAPAPLVESLAQAIGGDSATNIFTDLAPQACIINHTFDHAASP